MAPFNSEARYEIKQRSGNRSELDGKEYLHSHLKCGHLNHDKDSPDYNNPENGMRITIWQEAAYHMIHQPKPKEIGLSNENNRRAVQCNIQEMIDTGYTYDEVRKLVGEAIGQWEEWKKEKLIRENIEQAHKMNGSGEKHKELIKQPQAPYVEFENMEEINCLYYEPDPKEKKGYKFKNDSYTPPAL